MPWEQEASKWKTVSSESREGEGSGLRKEKKAWRKATCRSLRRRWIGARATESLWCKVKGDSDRG